MFKFLKKDSFWLGLILGILMPAIVSGLLYFFNINYPNHKTPVFKTSTILILGIVPNAIVLRYYLVNLKADKTGRGILAVTFVFAIVFMIFYYL